MCQDLCLLTKTLVHHIQFPLVRTFPNSNASIVGISIPCLVIGPTQSASSDNPPNSSCFPLKGATNERSYQIGINNFPSDFGNCHHPLRLKEWIKPLPLD